MTNELLEDLVDANHILTQQGIFDAYGHVSVRDPANPESFWISRSLAPGLVSLADLYQSDLDGNPIGGSGPRPYIERFIHGEIFRRRADVQAVIHNHSPTLVVFANSDIRLRPMTQSAAFIGDGPSVFDMIDIDDCGDLLISNAVQARALAESLGADGMVLMRCHGVTIVGASVRQAVRRAIVAERNAIQQLQAMSLGAVHFLRPKEIAFARPPGGQDADRGWGMWRQAARDR
jgi:ribulose-5-phosphate 4-epimerase/fuculose-1-phosphate aldolase